MGLMAKVSCTTIILYRALIPSNQFSTVNPDVRVTSRTSPPFSRVDSAAQFTVTKLDDLVNWAHRVSTYYNIQCPKYLHLCS